VAATVLAVLGGGFCLAGVLEFRRARTTVNPVNPASSALVVRRVYRLTRNPMYLGFALLLLAFALGLGKLSGLLAVMVFMAYLQHFQIRPEEAALRTRFGAAFDRYCQQVRRWL
jgi:protein-S-isoprenylcysteine O-methyltransferase Ste14